MLVVAIDRARGDREALNCMFLNKAKQNPGETAVPAPFAEVFGRLVRRTTVPGGRLDPGTVRDYWTVLQELPLEALAAGADDWVKLHVFFPAVAQWRAAALRHRQRVADCPACLSAGLIQIAYQSGELFDVAICTCRAGQWYRVAGPDFVRLRLGLQPSQQVAFIEDVETDA